MMKLLLRTSIVLTTLMVGGFLSTFWEPATYSRQIITPNTGSQEPGLPPSQTSSQSGMGSVSTNPGPYQIPPQTPPISDRNRSCTNGILGNPEHNGGSGNAAEDFNRSYQCYSGISPGLLNQRQSAATGQQAGMAASQPYYVPNTGVNAIPGIGQKANESTGTNNSFGAAGSSSAAPGGAQVKSSG